MNGIKKLMLIALSSAVLTSATAFSSCQCEGQDQFDVTSRFTASGWLGDGVQGTKYIQLFEASNENPRSAPACIKVVYSPGPNSFGGIYWQNKPNNWGDEPGDDLSKGCYQRLTFWARGANGGEVIECKAGGINTPGKKYKDSFEVTTGRITLEREWKQYALSLNRSDLSSVIGGFCWVAAKGSDLNSVTFYLDDIYYESSK